MMHSKCPIKALSATVAFIACALVAGVPPVSTGSVDVAAATTVQAVPPVAIPADGHSYFGVHLAWEVDSPAAYAARLGRAPMVYGDFVGFPLTGGDKALLSRKADLIAAVHGKFMITLMPQGGLKTVTDATARDLARLLARFNARGVDVFVRFGHEMNGSWYVWGQKPAAFIRAFRTIAIAVHTYAPRSAMIWAPSYGGGYPFLGGRYNPKPGTPAFTALDTNHDGRLTGTDDPYQPYYPGDAYVDWVGLTDYYWGNTYPWGKNELPEPNLFVRQLTGSYTGVMGDQRTVPNFYVRYVVGHNKPFALVETSALYNPSRRSGASDYTIKITWAHQIFSPDVARRFPRLKMVLWFEGYKYEKETHTALDWTATCRNNVLAGFRAALPARLIFSSWRPAAGFSPNTEAGCPSPR